jgi:PAS domain S-box-containing protein
MFPTVGKKLVGLAIFGAASIALIAVIAGIAFYRVETLSSEITGTQIRSVLGSAAIGRELSAAFSELDLISRNCRGDLALEDLNKHVLAKLAEIAKIDQDKQQADAVTVLSTKTTELVNQCTAIRRTLASLNRIDHEVLVELAKLESLVGRTLIKQTLAGKDTDYLDQIITLITGFRETLLEIGKRIAESGAAATDNSRSSNVGPIFDDLILRLQTLTASEPEIAHIAKRAIRLVGLYRAQAVQLEIETRRFNDAVNRSHEAKATVLDAMSRLDEQASNRTEGLDLAIRHAVREASRWVVGLSILITILSFLLIALIVKRSINQPLKKVLQHINAVRHGTDIPGVAIVGGDEWATIHSALQEMTVALTQSESLLQTVIDTAPVRAFWKDLDLRYLGCNPAFARDAGKSCPQDVIGKDDYQMGWAEYADLYRADDRAVIESGISKLSYEEPQATPDGKTIWLRTSKVPLKNADNDTIGILGIYEDITERKEEEAELARYRQHLEELVAQRTSKLMETEQKASLILESAADGLFGVDIDGNVTFINPSCCQIFGYSSDQVVGRSAHALFHHKKPDGSPYPADLCPSHSAWREGRKTRIDDETYWHVDGRPIPVAVASHPIVENGTISGSVVSVVDMSERHAAIQAREKALIAAENLARARSEFLANMSHEIRTPMNGVLGFASIGYRNYQDAEKARNAFEKIIASGQRLLGVVNEILDFSKIEAGKLKIEKISMSLPAVINSAKELVADTARAKGLELRLELAHDLPPLCVSDPMRVGQVLLNLLSNAVKFTDTGSITLAALRQGNELVFRVTDTGIGMNEKELDYVFDPFLQADGSSTRHFGGTGLGLAICKRISELMNGSIGVESSPGVGSTFEFRIPYVKTTEEAAIS